ncbi:MAG: helix-turn-helix transcriptional regulator [Chloroflexi bacterium]|nr:MAG: helix-turn-helix transcriptional regulator [Chloroflexota bacterium]
MPRTRPASRRRADKERFGGLTAREREVAGLIARGMSNREIADALFLSERRLGDPSFPYRPHTEPPCWPRCADPMPGSRCRA